jgi:MscS family membrane protein
MEWLMMNGSTRGPVATLWLAFLLTLGVAAPSLVHAEETPCASPQQAARSLVDNLMPDNWEPRAAWQCLDIPPNMSRAEAEVRAIQLKKVLDARGLYIPVASLSLEPNYRDPQGGSQVQPLTTFPTLVIEQAKDGRWLYSRNIVHETPKLYDATFSAIPGWLQARIPASMEGPVFGLYTWQLAYLIFLGLLSLLSGLLAQRLVSERFLRIARRGRIELSPEVVRSTRMPITIFAVGLVALWGIPDLQLGVQSSRFLLFVATGATSVAVVLVASRIVDIVANFFSRQAEATESKLDDQVIPLASRATKTAIWVVGAVAVIQNLGIDVTGLVAGVGVGSLAFALAAQDTVENLFGSVTIFTDRPFQIGDWVIIGGNIEGVVEEVGFRSTRIRTFTGSVVSVPNAKVANSTVDNMGQRKFRRVKTTLSVTYDTSPETLDQFVKEVRSLISTHPSVAESTKEVHFKGFGDSALEVMVYFFLDVPDWTTELSSKAEIYSEVIRIAERLNVEFAFPSVSLYVEKDAERNTGTSASSVG